MRPGPLADETALLRCAALEAARFAEFAQGIVAYLDRPDRDEKIAPIMAQAGLDVLDMIAVRSPIYQNVGTELVQLQCSPTVETLTELKAALDAQVNLANASPIGQVRFMCDLLKRLDPKGEHAEALRLELRKEYPGLYAAKDQHRKDDAAYSH